MNLAGFSEKLNKISLYLASFSIPIFFLPFSQNVLDFPKGILVSILVLLSLIGWLGRQIYAGKLIVKENKIVHLSLFLIFLSILFSSIFSIWPKASFLGYRADFSDNFLTLFLLLVLIFLLINSFEDKREYSLLVSFFILSTAIAGILNLLQIYKIFILPFDFSKTSSFNPIGTPNTFALLSAIFFPIALFLFTLSKRYWKIILGISSFILFLNILLINFKTAWLALIINTLILFIFGLGRKPKFKFSLAGVLMVVLIISIFFIFFPLTPPGFPNLTPEVFLSPVSEVHILKGVFGQGIKNIIFGTGPGTFIFDYSKYHSPLMNQTLFWGTRFPKGNSVFLDWLATKGFFGALSLLFLYLMIIYLFFRYLKENEKYIKVKLVLSASLLSLIVVSFFYPFNFSLYFALVFLAGGFLFFFSAKTTEISLSSPSKNILVNAVLMLAIISTIVFGFFAGQSYFAEAEYLKGINASQKGKIDMAITYLEKAIKLRPSEDVYLRDLSQLYLVKSNLVSQDEEIPPDKKTQRVNSLIVKGAEKINKAVNIGPVNVANWNVRGFFYRNLIGIEGAGEIALASYQKAIKLEPSSPYSYGERARVHILMAQDFAKKGDEKSQKQHLELALDDLKKTIELKSDYAPAHYLLAVAYDQLGQTDKAISKLEEAKKINPKDPGIAFQLGLLYWRKEILEKAQEEFERAINLSPNYSNAIYMLGLIYDKKGEKEKAREEFEKVLKLNPENETVKKVLENLKKGMPALAGVSLSTPPIQKTPSEIRPK